VLCLIAPSWSRDGWWRQIITPGLSSQGQVFQSAATIGGSIYIAGANFAGGGFYSTQIYIPEINRWNTYIQNPGTFTAEDMDSVGGMLLMIGGPSTGSINTIYYLHVSNISSGWVMANQAQTLPTRSQHTAVTLGGSLLLFGGIGTQYYNQIYQYDTTLLFNGGKGTGWALLSTNGAIPAARAGHSAATYGGSMYVFGGFSYNMAAGPGQNCSNPSYQCTWYNDLWAFSLETMTWTKISPQGTLPMPRYGHSADVLGDRMLVFAGNSNNQLLNDLWSYSFARNVWEQLMPSGAIPGQRSEQATAIIGMDLYVIGGTINYNDDLWAFTLNVEQTYDTGSSDEVDIEPVTGAAVFNVFFLAVVGGLSFLTYRKVKGRKGHEYIGDNNL